MSLATIRDGLKTRGATITALANRCHDVWPDQLVTPCLIVRPVSADLNQNMGDSALYRFELILLAAPFDVGYARGQDAIDAYLDPSGSSSICAAVEGDRTLAGACDSLAVTAWRDYGDIEVNGQRYWGVVFDVEVLV